MLGLGQDGDDYDLDDVHEKKYAEMKEEFEETHFKIKDCDLFLFKNKREIYFTLLLGSGGLLGVLPAVEMKNWSAASIYLFCFVVSSTLCV